MLPTRLNLLSPQKQQYLHKMVYVQFLKHLLELVLFLVTLVAIVLMGADTMLHNYFTSITSRVDVSAERISDVNQNVQFINSSLNRTYLIQEEFLSWPKRVESIAATVPPGVQLKSMSLQPKNNKYVFSGTANTREDLLAFEAALEALPHVSSVSFPISQLTKKENISFSMTALLKK